MSKASTHPRAIARAEQSAIKLILCRDINVQNGPPSFCFIFGGFAKNGDSFFIFQGFFITLKIKKVTAIWKSRRFSTFFEIGYFDQWVTLCTTSSNRDKMIANESKIIADFIGYCIVVVSWGCAMHSTLTVWTFYLFFLCMLCFLHIFHVVLLVCHW